MTKWTIYADFLQIFCFRTDRKAVREIQIQESVLDISKNALLGTNMYSGHRDVLLHRVLTGRQHTAVVITINCRITTTQNLWLDQLNRRWLLQQNRHIRWTDSPLDNSYWTIFTGSGGDSNEKIIQRGYLTFWVSDSFNCTATVHTPRLVAEQTAIIYGTGL